MTVMIPNEDQLEAISHLDGGDLSEIPFAVLLHALATHQRTVVLEIERKPMRKEIIFEAGEIVDCRSNLLHETLGRFMVARGDLSEKDFQDCLAKSAARGVQFGEVLIFEGFLTAVELYKLLQQNLAKKLLDGFTWRSGVFHLSSVLPKVESSLTVKAAQLVVTGISKFAGTDEVNEAIGPLVGKRLFLHPSPPFPCEEIHLSKAQRELVNLLEQGRRIDELAAETTIPFEQIMRLLYSLAVIGVVVPRERLPRAAVEQAEPAIRVADDQPAPAPAVDRSQVEELRNTVMESYLRYRKLDAFDLLEVREDALAVDIEAAFLEYSEKFSPWRIEHLGLGEIRKKAEDLLVAGARALGELVDVEQRNALLMRRKTLREEIARKPKTDRYAIKSHLLDSELQFKKGKALMQAERFHEAVNQLQFAYDCDPQNPEYRSELAYCKYLETPDLELRATLNELDETLRINPDCGLALYYSGLLKAKVGEAETAEERLRRAIKLMMPDRRPIEALKELQNPKRKRSRTRVF